MTVNAATLDEIGPEEEGTWIETFGSVVRVALAVAAIAGAFALVSGWFGGIGFDGSDLISVLGGDR